MTDINPYLPALLVWVHAELRTQNDIFQRLLFHSAVTYEFLIRFFFHSPSTTIHVFNKCSNRTLSFSRMSVVAVVSNVVFNSGTSDFKWCWAISQSETHFSDFTAKTESVKGTNGSNRRTFLHTIVTGIFESDYDELLRSYSVLGENKKQITMWCQRSDSISLQLSLFYAFTNPS
jgi:hypothetical protein